MWQPILTFIAFTAILAIAGYYTVQSGGDTGAIWVPALTMAVLFGLLLIPAIYSLTLSVRIRRELAENRVEMADGQVVWKRGRLVAEIPGRRLRPIFSDTLNLLPGAYHFYYLSETGGLLSAEALGMADRSKSEHELLDILAKSFHFDPAWLALNHEGKLAVSQARRLSRSSLLYFVGVAFVCIFAWGFTQPMLANLQDPGSLIFPGLILLGILAIGLRVAWNGIKVILDAIAGRVLSKEGPVHKSVQTGRATTYYYSMGDLRWRVPYRAYDALVEGLAYRIYYAPRSLQLVAIEPLDAGSS